MEIGATKLVNVISSSTNKEATFVPSSVAENQDVLREILSRLPVKSLVRFKCVSKDWFALLNQVLILIMKSNLGLLRLDNLEGGHHHQKFSLLDKNDDTLSSIESPALVLDQSIESVQIAGSDKGLVCLHLLGEGIEPEQIVIWNPVTKQYKKLPQPLYLEKEAKEKRIIMRATVVGFRIIQGHGKEDIDYKVVRISVRNGRLATQVFTRSAKSWRVLKDSNIPCDSIDTKYCVTLNGVLYFLAAGTSSYVSGLNDGWRIFLFNLDDDEVIHSMPLPSGTFGSSLFAWNNKVAIACSSFADRNSSQYDVWVMARDDTQMPANWNWTKQVTMKPPDGWIYGHSNGVWDDEFILFKFPNDHQSDVIHLCAYDLGNQRERVLIGPEGLHDYPCHVVDYEESLVSVE